MLVQRIKILKRLRHNGGFTLVEVLVVLALMGMVMSLGYSLNLFGVRVFHQGTAQANVQANVRLASDFITKETRNATEMTILNASESIPEANAIGEDIYYILLNGNSIEYRYKDHSKLLAESITELEFKKSSSRTLNYIITGNDGNQNYSVTSNIFISNLNLTDSFIVEDTSGGQAVALRFKKNSIELPDDPGGGNPGGGEPGPSDPKPEERDSPWVDHNDNGIYDGGDEILKKNDLDGYYKTTGRLIIPSKTKKINGGGREVKYEADKGIYISKDVEIENHSYQSIIFETKNGNIILEAGVSLTSSKDILLNAPKGNIQANGASMKSSSNGDISISAGVDVSLNTAIIQSSSDILITGAGSISGKSATLKSDSYGGIIISGKGTGDFRQAQITSSNNIKISTQGNLDVSNGILKSASNGPIILATTGTFDMTLESTVIQSSGRVELTSGKSLYAANSSIVSTSNGGTYLKAQGEIYASDSQMPASGALNITAITGDITVRSAAMKSTGYTDIWVKSGGNIHVESTDFDASRDLILEAGSKDNTIYISNAKIKDSNSTAEARPDGVPIDGKPYSGKICNGTVTITAL
ncbi:prepilin-type N-terminal cleavage/methylation domain-containing protein [Anaerosolibacter carboniphilus]|uniref:Prepilin-type N-terminal cleavage/methylation domain-containing protein n=1 Tax=Anaerosolibacter carboniphilus TaxID=1417629 RepID=A0A841KS93_9FIRM|nr:prepilin-type N-terminal cleavage/methylation domain-containing protein [Anaerosolibacter carboniphilus]MBB6216604.1 prepilin-type N-terminal cleavage/methylation domain-containing protein [Anaerosolibacter carboniphilus]